MKRYLWDLTASANNTIKNVEHTLRVTLNLRFCGTEAISHPCFPQITSQASQAFVGPGPQTLFSTHWPHHKTPSLIAHRGCREDFKSLPSSPWENERDSYEHLSEVGGLPKEIITE